MSQKSTVPQAISFVSQVLKRDIPACQIPRMVPTETQAARLLNLIERAIGAGWQAD
jgi:hypothetical protein